MLNDVSQTPSEHKLESYVSMRVARERFLNVAEDVSINPLTSQKTVYSQASVSTIDTRNDA
jgi:hypothetical protein